MFIQSLNDFLSHYENSTMVEFSLSSSMTSSKIDSLSLVLVLFLALNRGVETNFFNSVIEKSIATVLVSFVY